MNVIAEKKYKVTAVLTDLIFAPGYYIRFVNSFYRNKIPHPLTSEDLQTIFLFNALCRDDTSLNKI